MWTIGHWCKGGWGCCSGCIFLTHFFRLKPQTGYSAFLWNLYCAQLSHQPREDGSSDLHHISTICLVREAYLSLLLPTVKPRKMKKKRQYVGLAGIQKLDPCSVPFYIPCTLWISSLSIKTLCPTPEEQGMVSTLLPDVLWTWDSIWQRDCAHTQQVRKSVPCLGGRPSRLALRKCTTVPSS